jgi:eukaryotic translation initiation factor 2C
VEWLAIKKALATVFGTKQHPKVAFICVQKRHQTRFYPNINEEHNQGNIMPGTVVDNDIVHPTQFNFYLASHSAIQGTTRAPHYFVLKNEIDILNADDVEAITNVLCHSYVRATRAVSYPAPTYYSHWLAKGAAAYLPDNYSMDDLEKLNAEYRASESFMKKYPMHFI